MDSLIYILVAASAFMIFFSVLNAFLNKNRDIVQRLHKLNGDKRNDENEELNQPFFNRFIKPVLDGAARRIANIAPKEIMGNLEKRVILAGSPYGLTVQHWAGISAALMFGLPLLTLVFFSSVIGDGSKLLLIILGEIAAGMFLPNLILSQIITDRQKRITNSLPDMLDLLTVCVEAGLNFDGALSKVIEKYPGELAVEFSRVLYNIRMGKSKRDALRSMEERVQIPDLTSLISSIIQADQFGIGISGVLKIQSDQMRQKRKQRAEEKAMKAPVKMLIPMVMFIFPTIFSVLLGPVAIKVIRTFMK